MIEAPTSCAGPRPTQRGGLRRSGKGCRLHPHENHLRSRPRRAAGRDPQLDRAVQVLSRGSRDSGVLVTPLIGAQNVPNFWLHLISVALSVIVGVLFVRHPGEGLLILTLLLIVFFMVEGISKLIFALTIRPFPNWGWMLASGIIGILLSFYLWSSLPITTVWLLGMLLGIQLICEGAALGYLAWQVRQS